MSWPILIITKTNCVAFIGAIAHSFYLFHIVQNKYYYDEYTGCFLTADITSCINKNTF